MTWVTTARLGAVATVLVWGAIIVARTAGRGRFPKARDGAGFMLHLDQMRLLRNRVRPSRADLCAGPGARLEHASENYRRDLSGIPGVGGGCQPGTRALSLDVS